jgi:hypothetical protein
MKLALAAVLGALALQTVVAADGASGPVPGLVTLEGVGGVVPGMSQEQVESRFGVRLRMDRFGRCAVGFLPTAAVKGYAIFWRGKLGSIWFERGARTDRGVRIGSTFAQLRRAYGRIMVRKDYYNPQARNVFVRRERQPHWRLRFDVSSARRVTRIAFGNWTVFLTEGCA